MCVQGAPQPDLPAPQAVPLLRRDVRPRQEQAAVPPGACRPQPHEENVSEAPGADDLGRDRYRARSGCDTGSAIRRDDQPQCRARLPRASWETPAPRSWPRAGSAPPGQVAGEAGDHAGKRQPPAARVRADCLRLQPSRPGRHRQSSAHRRGERRTHAAGPAPGAGFHVQGKRHGQARRSQPNRRITSVPLVPPKPKEFEIATSMRMGRASLAQ